jgi:hypothetical protein
MNRHRASAAAIWTFIAVLTTQFSVVAQSSTNAPFQIVGVQPIFNSAVGSNGYVITWNAAPGLVNYLSYANSADAQWHDLSWYHPGSNTTTITGTDYPPTTVMQRFYRARAEPLPSIVLSLVLDRSGSMQVNGGAQALALAVDYFISMFDDRNDYAAMVSFSSAASVNVPMGQPFTHDIENAVSNLNFGGNTCSDQGLTNGLAQINALNPPGSNTVRVIVFFTDGMANTFNYTFNCGLRNIGLSSGTAPQLFDPVTGNQTGGGCTVPTLLSSINPTTGAVTPNAVSTTACVGMHNEAQNRAERIAWLARSQGITVYCVGMGSPGYPGECSGAFPTLNMDFLKDLANTTDASTYTPNQPIGDVAIAADSHSLTEVFQTIASKVIVQFQP